MFIEAILVPLRTFIKQLDKEKELELFLSTFECTQDKDIEYFLHNRAVEFEKLSKARTYLVCSQRQLENGRNVHNLTYCATSNKLCENL